MNRSMILFVIGRVLLILGLLLLPPVAVALICHEGWKGVLPFLYTIGICLAACIPFQLRRPKQTRFYVREGFVIVALSWILLSLLGGLPFVFSGWIPSLTDAFFETSSGFTTTGASILADPSLLPHSLLFWRSSTHFVGGMGILVFVLAVMPRIKSEDVHIMRAEVPGPTFGKIQAKLAGTARILYLMYICMTLILIALLLLGGMPLFDSICNAFGAAGTGGFSITSKSIAAYASPYAEYVLAIGMFCFGANFALIYVLVKGQIRTFLRNEELRWYLGIAAAAITLICLDLAHVYPNFRTLFRDVFFTVSSIMTTTGYATADFGKWPLFSQLVLLFLMFVGGMAGSTAGGLKVSRVAVYVKSSFHELRRNASPNRRVPMRFQGKPITPALLRQFHEYLLVYLLIFTLQIFIVSLDLPDFLSTFSAVSACFNNIGPGFSLVGPAQNYSHLSQLSKWTLSIGMIMGRLELFPILVLFSPRTWRRI